MVEFGGSVDGWEIKVDGWGDRGSDAPSCAKKQEQRGFLLEEEVAGVLVGDFLFGERASAGADDSGAQAFALFDLIAGGLEIAEGFDKSHRGVASAFFASARAFDPVGADAVDEGALFEDGRDQEVALDAEGCGDTATIMDIEIGDGGGDDLAVLIKDGMMQESEVERSSWLHEIMPPIGRVDADEWKRTYAVGFEEWG